MTIAELIAGLPEAVVTGDAGVEIEQIEYDSRLIKRPALFFAVNGFTRDGYDFVSSAKAAGAVAVMGERTSCDDIPVHIHVPNIRKAMAEVSARFYRYPGKRLKVCGVTGTNGKTTTCFLLKKILEARKKTTGLVTSLLYDTGGEVFPADRTTPESLDLQRLFYLMKRHLCVNAVVEVSSHALALHRVDQVNFRVALFTNISRDHLDFHETMDAYLAAKAKLLAFLEGELSYAVINLDVPEFRGLFGELKSSHLSYSLSNTEADIYCARYELASHGTIFDLVTPMGTRTVEFNLPGRFNLYNAIAAAAGGLASGVDLDAVVTGLEHADPVPGRLMPVKVGQPFALYVDYAHTPDAITRLCETVRELTDGRLLILFGCGGDRDRGKRPLMGEAAVHNADYAVVTSDNPRSEDPQAIIEDIKPGLAGGDYTIVPDRREAIATILKAAKAGDVVLLAGKGAESYQEVNGERQPFDDRAEATKVLAEMGYVKAEAGEEK